MATRKAVYAGSWYPATRAECEAQIRSFLDEDRFRVDHGEYLAGIVPHAGWIYSGNLACRVIASLRGEAGTTAPDVVVIFGMHLPPNAPPYIMADGWWETPTGDLEVASDLAATLTSRFRFRVETAQQFTPDNTIELQLPFVKYFFDGARVLTIGPPPGPAAREIARSVIEGARELGLSIRIIGSSDLTHYGANFGFNPAGYGQQAYEWVRDTNDRRVIDRMLDIDPDGVIEEGLSHHNACCPGAAAAAIVAAQSLGARKSALVGYSSSYEKSPGSSFVGYTGVLFGT